MQSAKKLGARLLEQKIAYSFHDAVERTIKNPMGSVISSEDMRQDPVQNLKMLAAAGVGAGAGIGIGGKYLGSPKSELLRMALKAGTGTVGALTGANFVRGMGYEERNPVISEVKRRLDIDYYE